jgi:hypothetical protein
MRSSKTPATGPGQHDCGTARQQDAGDRQARSGVRKGEAENGDVVEVVADFAHDLPGPRVPVIAIRSEQPRKTFGFHTH